MGNPRRRRLGIVAVPLVGLLLGGGAVVPPENIAADPPSAIQRAMRTPASVFDLFLLKLEEKTHCGGSPKNVGYTELTEHGAYVRVSACFLGASYDKTDDLFRLIFTYQAATRDDPLFSAFDGATEERKEELLGAMLERMSRNGGIPWRRGRESQLSLPIATLYEAIEIQPRAAFSADDLEAFKRELADRTVLRLGISYPGAGYTAERQRDGEVIIRRTF